MPLSISAVILASVFEISKSVSDAPLAALDRSDSATFLESENVQAMAAMTCPFVTALPCSTRKVILPAADALIGLKSFIASTTQTG